jgi:hypothetical protein
MTNLQNLSVEQLRRVVAIKEQIEHLEEALEKIAGGRGPGRPPGPGRPRGPGRPPSNGASIPGFGRKRRRLSAQARARIAAGQRARWARVKGTAAAAAKAGKGKRKVSAATKARLAAIARARWAKAKAAGKSVL